MSEKSLAQWLDYWLVKRDGKEIIRGLVRIRQAIQQMDWKITQPIITVAGTNGKGSTCAFLTKIYVQAGYKVGTFTSPHLLKYNERIAINGIPASDEQIITSFKNIDASKKDVFLTYFEVNTLAAMDIFLANEVDIIILEVGLGGTLDAVNAFDADVGVITSVDIDHEEFLGNNRELIGLEKAGIFRTGKPAILAEKNPPQSVLDYIQKIKAVTLREGIDYSFEKSAQQWSFKYHPTQEKGKKNHNRFSLPIPSLRGAAQIYNASAALTVIECLQDQFPVDNGAIKRGLILVNHLGRFQILPGRPVVVLDVAHNPHAVRELKHNLVLLPYAQKKMAVFSILADKDIDSVLEIMQDEFDEWHIATLDSERAIPAEKLKNIMLKHKVRQIYIYDTIKLAYQTVLEKATNDDRIVVFGSFYTVAEVMHQN